MNAMDYTPEQALADATDAAKKHDFDGAILMLFNDADDGDIDITHFVSGATGSRLISYLEVLKTHFTLRILGMQANAND